MITVAEIWPTIQAYVEQHQALTTLVQSRLSDKRFQHSLGVAATAVKLGERWDADLDLCYVTGLCHDIAKEMPAAEQQALLDHSAFSMDLDIRREKPLWHGPVGALVLKQLMPDYPEITVEVVAACLWHTIGKPQMTTLEAVVFLADIIEPHRQFEGVEQLRTIANGSLNRGVTIALQENIEYLNKKGKKVHPQALNAYEYYKELN